MNFAARLFALIVLLVLLTRGIFAEVLIVSSSHAATCHCGANCLCSPCTGNCSVVERLQAEFLAKHPNQKPWIKTGYNTTPEMAGAKSARIQATVSGESYSGVTEYVECRIVNGKRVCGTVQQPAAQTKRAVVPQVQVQGRKWRLFR